jgi:4-diphosphocytidyl-2-C-methyl-D-erythritol kinase
VAKASAAVSRRAWAKVNLYLEVTGRRADGYHELESLIVFAGLGDRLDLRPAETLEIDVAGPCAGGVPAGADNLVARAARALAEHAGVAPAARIDLDKRIPAAAGIGGGSADAAAALEGLAAL